MKLLIRLLLCGTVLSSHSFAVASYFLASEKFKKYYSEFVAPDGYSLVDVTNGSQFLAKNQTGGWIVGNLEGEYSELPDLSAIANLTSLVGADASSYRFIGEQLYSTLYYPRSETYNLRPQVSVLIEHGDDRLIATPILSSDDSISTLLVAREPNSDVYLIREFFVGRNEYSFLNMEGNVRTTIETLLAPHFASIEPLSLNFRGSTLSGVAVFLVRGSDGINRTFTVESDGTVTDFGVGQDWYVDRNTDHFAVRSGYSSTKIINALTKATKSLPYRVPVCGKFSTTPYQKLKNIRGISPNGSYVFGYAEGGGGFVYSYDDECSIGYTSVFGLINNFTFVNDSGQTFGYSTYSGRKSWFYRTFSGINWNSSVLPPLYSPRKMTEEGEWVGYDSGENKTVVYLPVPPDADQDGILDNSDNCPSISNPDQADLDGDNIGDACDTDVDGDSVEDTLDNCPLVANQDQLDVDGDLIGDACDDLVDNDADGIANDLDNCPAVPNTDQADNDSDLQGDACDLDDDNDGVEDTVDNCSLTANEDQADNDNDNIGDVCDSDDDNDAIEDDLDNCPLIANVSQDDNDGDGFGDVCDPDDDNDAVDDSVDNCPLSFNPDQLNTDGVGAGDACNDAFDVDDDDWENDYDNCPDVANRNQSDFDYDNIGDACDTDVDGDSAANAADACELTPLGELVGSIGCSIEQLCPCDGPRQSTEPWKNHGKYVSCMTKAAHSFAADGVISDNGKSDLVNAAAQSSCGY